MDGKRILNDIKTRLLATGKSIHSFETYESPIKAFCLYFEDYHHPVHVPTKEIIKFLASIEKPSMARTAYFALKYFYKHIEKQQHKFDDLEPVRVKAKPRMPLDKEFILGKIESIENKRDKAIVAVLFSTGLRREEVAKLKVSDIDWKNEVIHVMGKGQKPGLAQLSPNLQDILTDYIVYFRPTLYLFPGERAGHWISPDTVYKIVKKYLNVSTHITRYSYANALRDAGADLLDIRDSLRHSSIKTTEGYLRNDLKRFKAIYNPLNDMKKPQIEEAA